MFDVYKLREKYPNFGANQEKCGKGAPCIVCGKQVKNPKWMAHLHDGGIYLVTEQEAQEMSDKGEMGWWPVGPDCYRSNPGIQPYCTAQPSIKATDWKELYFDLYRQTSGEQASEDEIMQDAFKRLEILNHYK